MTNLDTFLSAYERNLYKIRTTNPEYYTWDLEEFSTVFNRMVDAIKKAKGEL